MNFSVLKKSFLNLYKGQKKVLILSLISIIAVFLILFSECSSGEVKEADNNEFDITKYVSETEEKITKLVQMIEGAGKAEVMITPEKTVEYVYFQEEKTKTDTQAEDSTDFSKQTTKTETQTSAAMLENKSNGKEPLVTTKIMPKIAGVVVICDGGGNSVVQERIINAVSTALDIEQSRVFVTKKQR